MAESSLRGKWITNGKLNSSGQRWLFWLGWGLLLAGLAAQVSWAPFLLGWQATGTVVGIKEFGAGGGRDYIAVVEFSSASDGRIQVDFRRTRPTRGSRLRVGQTLDLVYLNPYDPSAVNDWKTTLIPLGLGAGALLFRRMASPRPIPR